VSYNCCVLTNSADPWSAHSALVGRLSWLHVSFLLHVRYTLSYCNRIVPCLLILQLCHNQTGHFPFPAQ